jgi:hypothetical protein
MDLPIGRVQWEVFLPQQYKVADFGGDAVPARLLPLSGANGVVGASGDSYPLMTVATLNSGLLRPGDVGGIITDPARAVVPSAVVEIKSLNTGVTWKAIADRAGRWVVSNLPAGRYQVLVTVPGFKMYARGINHDASRATEFPIALQVGSATESVTVTEEAPLLQTESGEIMTLHGADANRSVKVSPVSELPPSTNVTNLQQRVVGVLPIAVNVPRTGSSYRFVRALAVDEETTLTFHYRTK